MALVLLGSHDASFRIGGGNNSFGSCGKNKETPVARVIQSRPERILDAPDIINDYCELLYMALTIKSVL